MSGKQGTSSAAPSKRREYRKFRNPPKIAKKIVCKYFSTPEGCRFSENCRFLHDSSVSEELSNLTIETSDQCEVRRPVIYQPHAVGPSNEAIKPRIVKLRKEDAGGDLQQAQMGADIAFFKRRYPHSKIETMEDGTVSIVFRYNATDPDWIFEVKTLTFRLDIDPIHPIAVPKLSLPEEPNSCLPTLVQSHLSTKINEAIYQKYVLFEKRNQYENIGKSLIMWLDHSILEIFVEGLRRTKLALQGENIGLKLVKAEVIEKVVEEEKEEDKKSEDVKSEMEENYETEVEKPACQPIPDLPIDIIMIFKNHSGNIATIRPISLKVTTKCSRCGMERDSLVPTTDTVVGWRCTKCSQAESIRIRAELVHPNSNVLAKADAKGCNPTDCVLLDSTFRIVCLACNREDDLQKINYGDTHKSWCRECHQLLEMSVSHVRFLGNSSKFEDRQVAGNIPKAKKNIEKRSAIIEGHPLPNMGACEHYRKSYRWFRFPCCGKLFPCDTCHEEKTVGEHEMKIANRIVCGHCSKEQPFQKDKPCISCGETTTRRRSQFWEGGKGCRDQTKMNRNDAHKFANSRKKTLTKAKTEKLVAKK